MFFLEISTVANKNIELVQKVMRIRSSHLIKKQMIQPTINNNSSIPLKSSIITSTTNSNQAHPIANPSQKNENMPLSLRKLAKTI